jgi:hypothetical protein
MLDKTEINALLARLRPVTTTKGGDIVEGLTVEADSTGKPKFIRGVILEPTTGSNMRRQPVCWMPTGKARVGGPLLDIFIPELSATPLT